MKKKNHSRKAFKACLEACPDVFCSNFHSRALVLVMPARLRDAISGILAGGIPGFGTATFLLGTSRSSLKC